MKTAVLTLAFAGALTPFAGAQTTAPDLAGSTMEQLTRMEVNINSVNRKDENLWRTAAAAYVITREDIEHSTAESVPELLRTVPGLQVAQISASTWAVSARGFNSAYANKLLVLIDGRTVYSEIYSGAHWDEIDLALDDVERIEVIRGPGAVIWGTNAVNGVVNIITRPARAVQSPAVSGEVSRMNDTSTVVQGSSFLGGTQYRDSFSVINRNPMENPDGSSAYDRELMYRADARFDWHHADGGKVSVLGGAYGGTLRQQVLSSSASMMDLTGGQEDDFLAGGFGLVRFEREAGRHSYEVQAYVSDAVRHELSATDRTLTESAELVDHIHANERIDLVTGAEFRFTQDAASAPTPVLFQPAYKNYLVDSFLQGDFTLLPDRFVATLGSKVQNGTLAGFQVQPTARLAWTIDTAQFAWAAVSRGVVAPSIQDRALSLDLLLGAADGMSIEGELTGNPAFLPETVLAYEAGYRRHILPRLSVDIAAFYNVNHRLQSVSAGDPTIMMDPTQHIMTPLTYGNGFAATTQGLEGSLDFKANKNLSLRGNYTWLQAQVTQKGSGQLTLIDGFDSPRNSVAGLWTWILARHWSFDGQAAWVGNLNAGDSAVDISSAASGAMPPMGMHKPRHADDGSNMMTPTLNQDGMVPAYTRLDAKVERHVGTHASFAAGGTNLLSPRHQEFSGFTDFLTPLYVPRSVFVHARWSF